MSDTFTRLARADLDLAGASNPAELALGRFVGPLDLPRPRETDRGRLPPAGVAALALSDGYVRFAPGLSLSDTE
eukprot:4929980-Amphidinium_carterae.1